MGGFIVVCTSIVQQARLKVILCIVVVIEVEVMSVWTEGEGGLLSIIVEIDVFLVGRIALVPPVPLPLLILCRGSGLDCDGAGGGGFGSDTGSTAPA